MTRIDPIAARAFFALLALNALIATAAAQPSAEAESHILSAFTSRADPRLLAQEVKLGPKLREQLAGETDRGRIYAALTGQTADKPLRVSALSPVEATIHAPLVGGDLSQPLVRVEAGELALLMQYSAKDKQVVFVEQLRAPAPRAEPAAAPPPLRVEATPPQVETPQLPPEAAKPAPIVKIPLPATPPPVIKEKPAPPVAQKPKPASHLLQLPPPVTASKPGAPAVERSQRTECVIKPVMTDDELRACGASR